MAVFCSCGVFKINCCSHRGTENSIYKWTKKNFHENIVRSRWWTAITLLFTVVLLFGPELRILFFPKESDVYFDYGFTTVFAILVVDILLRSYVSPGYFQWSLPSRSKISITVGSFMFWCDVFSTFILLTDISFLDVNEHFQKETIHLSFGDTSPQTWTELTEADAGEFDWNWKFVLNMFRSARIARLARASAIVKTSKLSMYPMFAEIFFCIPLDGKKVRKRSAPRRCFNRFCRNRSIRNEAAIIIQQWWRSRITHEGIILGPSADIKSIRSRNKKYRTSGSNSKIQKSESQVGSAMRELTGQRVALGIMLPLILSSLFRYSERDRGVPKSVLFLDTQIQSWRSDLSPDQSEKYINMAVNAARSSSLSNLYEIQFPDDNISRKYPIFKDGKEIDINTLREMEIIEVKITNNAKNSTSTAYISKLRAVQDFAVVELLSTIFVLVVWFYSVVSFTGPVMSLVVLPIERMIRLLGMMTAYPLGYQSSPEFRQFLIDQDNITKITTWTPEVLKGMETSFLMSTILRIGSLMKVGFGSAGVEIIRRHLGENSSKESVINSGCTVTCIFMFCDIRQFTDATECLQEEVFVFTNKIAAVVHSICNSYGGSANKNIGDAFLLSWLLMDDSAVHSSQPQSLMDQLISQHQRADKALLSVVKICFALHHDKYFLEDMSQIAKDRLLNKLADRAGPVVQMGMGLHAGNAVQGAIGTERKLDATYVSEAVEMAETLESSTKRYGVKVLMSESFHKLLSGTLQRDCRKVDQILTDDLYGDSDDEDNLTLSNIYTYDMDIDAKWSSRDTPKPALTRGSSDSMLLRRSSRRSSVIKKVRGTIFSASMTASSAGLVLTEPFEDNDSKHVPPNNGERGFMTSDDESDEMTGAIQSNLVLPSGTVRYSIKVWRTDDMKKIRARYVDGKLFENFHAGLECYYAKDWEQAQVYFSSILAKMDDGPTRYFMNTIREQGGVPPPDFVAYTTL